MALALVPDRSALIVVDTFSGDKPAAFLGKLRELRPAFVASLFVASNQMVLRARVERRPAHQFKDLAICQRLNADTTMYLQPGERVVDNSGLSPQETVDVILGAISTPPGPRSTVVGG